MKVSITTIVLLVALRLAIGWHLFYEGAWKQKNKDTFSSRGYLANASGPLAPAFRWTAGDPDVSRQGFSLVTAQEIDPTPALVERYTVVPIPAYEDPSKVRWHQHLPKPLVEEWDAYFARFVKHYHLDADENRGQKAQAEGTFEKAKADTVKWMIGIPDDKDKAKKVPRQSSATGFVLVPTPPVKRLDEYLAKRKEIQEIRDKEVASIGPKAQPKLDRAVAEERAMRQELTEDVDAQTARMKQELRTVLTPEQRRMALLPEADRPTKEWKNLAWIDWLVRWSLIAVGLCLLVGLFSRTACMAGFCLLLAFFLTAPAPPFGPTDPASREHYFLIDTRIIECVALLALATTRSGRWFGLDGLVQFLRPSRWRRAPATVYVAQPHSDLLSSVPAGSDLDGLGIQRQYPTRRHSPHGT